MVEVGGNNVVIVELHAVKAELFVFLQLGGKGDFLANFGPKRIAARGDVPGAEGEAIFRRHERVFSSSMFSVCFAASAISYIYRAIAKTRTVLSQDPTASQSPLGEYAIDRI